VSCSTKDLVLFNGIAQHKSRNPLVPTIPQTEKGGEKKKRQSANTPLLKSIYLLVT
jgi:hypothetical protein